MAYYNRWWVSPTGDIISVEAQNHITEIIRNPERFGTTREHVEEVYARHGERLGQEGNAREEIMKQVMDKGWIRMRDAYGPDSALMLETSNLSAKKGRIADILFSLLDSGKVKGYDPVIVMDWRTQEFLQEPSAKEMIRKIYAKKKATLTLLKVV